MANIPPAILPKSVLDSSRHKVSAIRVSPLVVESAALDAAGVYARLKTRPEGLTTDEAAALLAGHGPNVLAKDQRAGLAKLLWRAVLNPLVILLAVLATISFATGDLRAGIMMVSMIVLSVGLKLIQEFKAGNAAAKLKAMISVTATVLRDGVPLEIPVAHLVPGDVVQLAAGDMIPGDVRILQAKDLFVIQGSLTGESFPVEKYEVERKAAGEAVAPIELTSIAFLGTSVESGSASAVVARKICKEVGLSTEFVVLGDEVEKLTDEQLAEAAEKATLFARVSPAHKQRIIRALQSRKHTVGFMGDGINDAPALHAADVGISVDTAVDIAKESADMILLEKSLLVLDEGVLEGRRVFSNIIKYVRMGASSNFGNMFSVLGASVFVPFLPMLPVQILANNLLYDIGQTAIPTDAVDPERITAPRQWDIRELTRFVLFIGPCSSIFDYTTFLMMLYTFKCWDISTPAIAAHSASVFQTGWFVESLLTQTLIIHVIRTNKIPFLQSRPSWPVALMSVVTVAVGIAIPLSPLGRYLGFTALPPLFWPLMALTLVCYVLLTQGVKMWLLRRKWI